MKLKRYLSGVYLLLLSTIAWCQAESHPVALLEPIDMERAKEIAEMLPDTPRGLGNTYKDRKTWDRLYATGKYKKTITQAEEMLSNGFPIWDQALYDRMFSHGDTQSGKDMINNRLKCLSILVWAECLENKGRFTSTVEGALYDIMKQKSWVNPKHYYEHNYQGWVELATALNCIHMAQAVYLLDDKLKPSTRTDLLQAFYSRAFNPLMGTFSGKNKDHWWLTGTSNWNAACLDGVTCAALTIIPDKMERAIYATIAERYIRNFVAGFLNDGYCTEGLSYYNFGMMHYIALREKLWQDTQGRLDLFKEEPEKIYKIACFPPNMEIINGIYPAIADCKTGSLPSKGIMHYLSKSMGLKLEADNYRFEGITHNLGDCIINVFPSGADVNIRKDASYQRDPLRSYFPDGGLLVVRSKPEAEIEMGAALKGGNNNEHHNHNDIGSYTLVLGKERMIEDPGLIPYDSRTFGPERYTAFKTLASYGHPVPLISGKDQRDGKEAQARVFQADFTSNKDIFAFDFSSAYPVSSLTKLTREFVFERKKSPVLSVKDVFAFRSPDLFETALTTRAQWQRTGDNTLLLTRGKEKMEVTIDTGKQPFEISDEIITEKGTPYTRLGIRLKEKQTEGSVIITYKAIR